MAVNGKMSLTVPEVGDFLEAGLKSVMMRGKATVGEKTMIDAMQPAVEAFRKADSRAACSAAKLNPA